MIPPALILVDSDQTSTSPSSSATATLFAGLADRNANLFRRLGLPLGDPAAWLELPSGRVVRIVRDLEMDRARARAHEMSANPGAVHCPADFKPEDGELSSDRETAVAQSIAVLMKQEGVTNVIGDRSLPLIYVYQLAEVGIRVQYDAALGVIDRRPKSASEIEALAHAQHVTEQVMFEVCHRIATATVDDDGQLFQDGGLLTSERLVNYARRGFMERGFTMSHGAIVACPPHSADCHHAGTGPLYSGVPIIVDLFPRDELTRYHGDCTRTVVHGTPSDEVIRMHAAVVKAKAAAEAELYPGRTAEAVHLASDRELIAAGYQSHRGQLTEAPSIQHGTGHGIGLEIHEPILLDFGGEAMLEGEVFTVEPGLYGKRDGGVRVEDMLVVTQNGPRNLNQLPQGLNWE
ncbi:M24 family metallopeptidase [Neorhodopirellula pilleata]|uniref:Xaa-Pro aminopeptidase 1 n=1 Tax=Neorhodopirellula pilleata TaxID=2714738 RepID=A0A5C6A0T3_9BACT|nr:M24 family metallopeptidase [Neorhodopirellula pilleata]TWT93005.1 Xaa-Pro aminopeptidase 1 [Neorhodopirellula pilleata]